MESSSPSHDGVTRDELRSRQLKTKLHWGSSVLVNHLQRIVWERLRSFGVWGILDQAALAGSGFLITISVARTGGPEALGVFALIQGGVLLFAGLIKSAVGDPLVIQVRSKTEEDLRCVTPLVLLHLAMGLVLAALALLYNLVTNQPVNLPALALALLLPMAGFQEIARSFRLAGMSERHLFLGDALVATIRIGSLGLFLVGIEGAPLGLSALVFGGLASIISVKQYLAPNLNVALLMRLWRLGRWFVTESVLYGIGQYGIWFVAVPAAGVAVAGEVRGAQQLFGPVLLIQGGLSTILLARLSRTQGHFQQEAVSLATAELTFSIVWGTLIVTFGSSISSIILGRSFLYSRFELLIMSFSIVAGTAYGLFTLALRARGRGHRLVLARAAAVAVTLCGIALSGRSFVGIVISLLVGQLAGIIAASHRSGHDPLQSNRSSHEHRDPT